MLFCFARILRAVRNAHLFFPWCVRNCAYHGAISVPRDRSLYYFPWNPWKPLRGECHGIYHYLLFRGFFIRHVPRNSDIYHFPWNPCEPLQGECHGIYHYLLSRGFFIRHVPRNSDIYHFPWNPCEPFRGECHGIRYCDLYRGTRSQQRQLRPDNFDTPTPTCNVISIFLLPRR